MKPIIKKVIKVWIFIFFSFIFLNIYFPQKSSANDEKVSKTISSRNMR